MDWMHVLFAYKMKVYVKDFFSKSKQIRSFLRIFSYLIKKFLLKKYIFFTVVFPDSAHLRELHDHTKSSNSYIEILHTYIDWPETSLLEVCYMWFSIFNIFNLPFPKPFTLEGLFIVTNQIYVSDLYIWVSNSESEKLLRIKLDWKFTFDEHISDLWKKLIER